MLRSFLALVLLLGSTSVAHKQIEVAVIDTGIRTDVQGLCESGHVDLTGEGLYDYNGHGTNVSGLIHRNAKDVDYCQVIIKYFKNDKENIERTIVALRYAMELGVDVINYSSQGGVSSFEEYSMIKQVLDSGIKIVAPSGNFEVNLDNECVIYPACYDPRIFTVGRLENLPGVNIPAGYGRRLVSLENGTNQTVYGITMSGTSQATAIFTGKLIKKMGSK